METIGALDWTVIAVYLIAMVAFGLWLARKTKSGEDYYLAGRNVPRPTTSQTIAMGIVTSDGISAS